MQNICKPVNEQCLSLLQALCCTHSGCTRRTRSKCSNMDNTAQHSTAKNSTAQHTNLLLQEQPVPVLLLCLQSTLQHNDCTELVEDCIVLSTVHVLHTTWAAAGRFAATAFNQLQRLLQQHREQRHCLHSNRYCCLCVTLKLVHLT